MSRHCGQVGLVHKRDSARPSAAANGHMGNAVDDLNRRSPAERHVTSFCYVHIPVTPDGYLT